MDTRVREEKLRIIRQDGAKQENILEILIDLQFASEEGCIDKETAAMVAEELHMTETRVYEIVSYYAMLKDKPQAKYVLKICNSSPCHFSRSEEVCLSLEKKLGVPMGRRQMTVFLLTTIFRAWAPATLVRSLRSRIRYSEISATKKISALIDDLRRGKIAV